MNVLGLASECSSGYESGWTNYLDESFLSANPSLKGNGFKDRKSSFFYEHGEINGGKEEVDDDGDDVEEEEEEEEDLSTVSDASSGPPHFYKDHNGYFNDDNDNQYQYTLPEVAALHKNGGKTHINKKEHRRCREDHQELPSFLDDTASSTLISFSKKNFARTNNQASMESAFDYSQDFSATYFQGVPAFHGHFGFFQSSPSGNQLQTNRWF